MWLTLPLHFVRDTTTHCRTTHCATLHCQPSHCRDISLPNQLTARHLTAGQVTARHFTAGQLTAIVYYIHTHTHIHIYIYIFSCYCGDGIKNRVVGTQDAFQNIIAEETANVSALTAKVMPSESAITYTVNTAFAQQGGFPADPKTLHDIALPGNYKVSATGDQFLQFDSGPGDDRILIFCTERGMQILERAHIFRGALGYAPPLWAGTQKCW